jgi:signal peptidase I
MKAGRLWLNGAEVETRPAGVGESETEDGTVARAMRYVETLPGGHAHPIFKLTDRGSLDNTPEVIVPAGNVFVMGDNRDNSADSRVPLSFGGVGLLPVSDLIGRVETVIGSWDLAIRRQPVWEWPSGLRLSRFFTAVH